MRDRVELRSQDPVALAMIRHLSVPRIYFEADWPGMTAQRVDVLAIDRDGHGDVHLILIKKNAGDALALIPKLFQAQAEFRWIAFLKGTEDSATASELVSREILYPPNVAGRIGVIEIVEMNGDLGANIRIKAERFHISVYELAAEFIGSHKAHIQVHG